VLGIAAAAVIGMSVNAVATLLLAWWLHGGPDLRRLLATALRAALVALCAALVTTVAVRAAPSGSLGALMALGGGGLVYAGVVVLGAFTLGDDSMRDALRRLLRRRQRPDIRP